MNLINIEESFEENLWETPLTESIKQDLSKIDPWSLPCVPFNQRNTLPDAPGVYFCLKDRGVLYIGMSDKGLKGRWANHHRRRDLELYGCQNISYLELPQRTDILEVEKTLINMFTPKLNKEDREDLEQSLKESRENVKLLEKVLNRKRQNEKSILCDLEAKEILDRILEDIKDLIQPAAIMRGAISGKIEMSLKSSVEEDEYFMHSSLVETWAKFPVTSREMENLLSTYRNLTSDLTTLHNIYTELNQ